MIILFWLLMALLTGATLLIILWPLLASSQRAFKTAIIFLISLPVIAIFLYFRWGSSAALTHYWLEQQQAKIAKIELAKIKNPQQIIDQLKTHLQAHPESAKGWYLLGRLYLGMQQYMAAQQVLAKAYHLAPHDDQYSMAYAEATFFNNKQHLTSDTKQILQDIVKRSPRNVAAINLLALNAYFEKDYQLAINYWETLIPLFAPGSRDSQLLLAMIARAQRSLATPHPGPLPSGA